MRRTVRFDKRQRRLGVVAKRRRGRAPRAAGPSQSCHPAAPKGTPEAYIKKQWIDVKKKSSTKKLAVFLVLVLLAIWYLSTRF